MAQALNNPKSSGVKSTKDVFNGPEWIQSFEENWRKYARLTQMQSSLIKKAMRHIQRKAGPGNDLNFQATRF